jgi:hypothetical protein
MIDFDRYRASCPTSHTAFSALCSSGSNLVFDIKRLKLRHNLLASQVLLVVKVCVATHFGVYFMLYSP